MSTTGQLVEAPISNGQHAAAVDHAATVRTIVGELTDAFIERDEVIRTVIVTMLAGQHSLMLGPPGSAKSDIARAITNRITGATYFETLLTKSLDPTSIFGPIDIVALIQGIYRQVLKGYATQASIVFLDEVFKGNGVTLNGLLAYLNERIYHPVFGGDKITCPLLGAITASNEPPDAGDDLSAFYDRLLVRVQVDYIVERANFVRLLRLGAMPPGTTIHIDDLRTVIEQEIPRVTLPDAAINQILDIRTALRKEGLEASDRRWRASVSVLKASAWLDGRSAIEARDLRLLKHILWDKTSDRDRVYDTILTVIDPKAKEIREHMRVIRGVLTEFQAKDGLKKTEVSDWVINHALPKFTRTRKDLEAYLTKARADGRPLDEVTRAIGEFNTIVTTVFRDALDVDGPVIEVPRS